MVATSPSMRSHSWSDVYSVVMINPSAFTSSTFVSVGNKGHGGDPQRQSLPAQFGKYQCTDGGVRSRQITHCDWRVDAGAESTRGDAADGLGGGCIGEQRRAFTHRRAAFGLQPDAAAPCAVLKLLQNDIGTRETARARAAMAAALLNRPLQRALNWRRRGVDVVAVKTESCLQPQAVTCAEPDRQHVAAFKHPLCERFGVFGRNRYLKAVLAGVAGARYEAIDAVDPVRTGIHEPHRRRFRAELFEHGESFRPLQRDQRAIGQRLDQANIRQVGAQMRLVLGLAGGIY